MLLCLVLISAHFTSGLYAKFTQHTDGSDHAKIAAFQVTTELEKTDETYGYSLKVDNKSDTAIRYSFVIRLTDPEQRTLAKVVFGGEQKVFEDDGTVTLSDPGWELPAGGTNESAKPSFSFLLASDDQTQTNAPDYQNGEGAKESGEIPFEVRVLATQVD